MFFSRIFGLKKISVFASCYNSKNCLVNLIYYVFGKNRLCCDIFVQFFRSFKNPSVDFFIGKYFLPPQNNCLFRTIMIHKKVCGNCTKILVIFLHKIKKLFFMFFHYFRRDLPILCFFALNCVIFYIYLQLFNIL